MRKKDRKKVSRWARIEYIRGCRETLAYVRHWQSAFLWSRKTEIWLCKFNSTCTHIHDFAYFMIYIYLPPRVPLHTSSIVDDIWDMRWNKTRLILDIWNSLNHAVEQWNDKSEARKHWNHFRQAHGFPFSSDYQPARWEIIFLYSTYDAISFNAMFALFSLLLSSIFSTFSLFSLPLASVHAVETSRGYHSTY